MQSVEDDLRWRRTLLGALSNFAPAEASELAIHFGDLRHGFLHAVELIEELANTEETYDRSNVRRTLAHLKGELLEHIAHHIELVEPPLSSVVSRLYWEAEERGEFDD